METHYVAHGLHVTSSFRLPGMIPARTGTDGLPSLKLTTQVPAALDDVWIAADGPPEWRGRQGDGYDLVIQQGVGRDLLFVYGHRARFRLHSDLTQLDCAPSQPGVDWLRILMGKVLPSISVMRGYEALHAAVVDFPAGAVAILGAGGAGKSTLALELLLRGRRLFADDQLTLGHAKGVVWGFPGTPHMNIARNLPGQTNPQRLGVALGELAGNERWFAVAEASQEPRRVTMVCLLERSAGLPLALQTLSGNPLVLAPYMLGLSNDSERLRSRFDLYADLLESATLVRLTAGFGHGPNQLADLIERALLSSPEVVTRVAT
jgi:hypothetical protein